MKYLVFYLLLLVMIVLGYMQWAWLVVVPSGLILTGVFIAIKGADWRKLLGRNEMNGVVVFVATFITQVLVASLFFGSGRLIAMAF